MKRSVSHLGMIILAAAFLCGSGCTTSKPARDPLTGWIFRPFDDFAAPSDRHHYQLAESITKDYQSFISANHLDTFGAVTGFYENSKGQHAVTFEAFPSNQNAAWHYVLIYDNKNVREKVIKFGYRKFHS